MDDVFSRQEIFHATLAPFAWHVSGHVLEDFVAVWIDLAQFPHDCDSSVVVDLMNPERDKWAWSFISTQDRD